jgi:hypothetical protein
MNIHTKILPALAVLLTLAACRKDPGQPQQGEPVYSVSVKNEFNALQARLAVFLSNDDGNVIRYQELAGNATTLVEVPGTRTDDRFDCTIVKIITRDAPGTGMSDTLVNLTTYTGLKSGETINLRDLFYKQTTDLNLTFTNVTSVDSVVVPDGITFVRPAPSNNFNGQYRVYHTGKLWLRVKINGQSMWRFILFGNIDGPTLDATLDAGLMLPIFATPKKITLPFTAAWDFSVEGIVDTAGAKYLAMGDQLPVPGGAIPVYSTLDIFEPISNDVFDPAPKPYNGFRVRLSGADPTPGSYAYSFDRLYPAIPATLPVPAFDLQPTVLADNRLVATQCIGSFDVLAFTRSHPGTLGITWEVFMPPAIGIVSYRLPDVPDNLGAQFQPLKNYDFGGKVKVRAEDYEYLNGYETAIHKRLLNNDPVWQAKAGYLGREEVQ